MKYILLVFLVSCAHHHQDSKVVSLPFEPELLATIQKEEGRHPASVALDEKEKKSPRRVYFSVLYHQYLTLGNHLGHSEEITFCPQFHHDKIETDAMAVPQISRYKASHIEENGKNFFPELAFNKKFPLKDHYAAMKSELETLCEEGVSDDYFKFDNIVTHYAHKKAFHSRPEAMASLLKIPVFANFYLVKMLRAQRGLVLSHPEEKSVIELTQTHWLEKYVDQASRMRNNFIKNKMVRR